MALYDGWQRRRHRDLVALAGAVRAAGAKDFSQAIDQTLPAPKSLIDTPKDDGFDRSQWW